MFSPLERPVHSTSRGRPRHCAGGLRVFRRSIELDPPRNTGRAGAFLPNMQSRLATKRLQILREGLWSHLWA